MKFSLAGSVIGALVLINAGAFVAVDQHFQVTADAPASAAASDLLTPSPSSAVMPSSGAAAAPASNPIESPGVVTIASNATHAWRAVNSGGCAGSVRVQKTEDGGRTWSDLAKPPAAAASALGLDGTGHLQLSGQASDGCAQKTWSLSGGGSWYSSAATSWAPKSAKSADVIHEGKSRKACDAGSVIDTATAGDTADVLCSDGTVRSVSARVTAQATYRGAGLISIGTTGDNTLIVARKAKGCDGVELAKVTDKTAHRITCVEGADKAVDLTFAGDDGWLVAAHNTWTGKATGDWSKS